MATVSGTRQARVQPRSFAIWGVLVALGAAGLAIWGFQLANGLEHTGLGQSVVWGLYIAGFFAAAGAGAGALAFAGLAAFNPALRVGEWKRLPAVALAAFVAAGILITMDLGSPTRLWRIAFSGEWRSLMVWDFWLLLATMVAAVAYWWRLHSGRQDAAQRGLAALSMILAVALVVAESLLLADLAARESWASGLTVVSFLVAAGTGGFSLVLLTLQAKAPAGMTGWLRLALAASLVLALAEVVSGAVADSVRAQEQVDLLVTGAESPVFWLHIVGGLLLPLALLSWKTTPTVVSVAAVLALLGVLAEKVWMLAIGQAFPWVQLPASDYLPTWSEMLGVLGVVALAGLAYLLLMQVRWPDASNT